jgi:hypothetical protein
MDIGRIISLLAWAAILAAWALPQNGTVQKSFAQAPAGEPPAVDAQPNVTLVPPVQDAELVDHLGEELLPEDYSALANPYMRGLLPPVEFAHPYHGRVTVLRGQSQEAMRRICGQQSGGTLLGCAKRPKTGGLPFVALADDETVRMNGWTRNLNALHEAAHLNGSWGHDGWRDLAQMGRPIEAPKAIVVALADVPPEDQYDDPHPRRDGIHGRNIMSRQFTSPAGSSFPASSGRCRVCRCY